jgi:putative tricarboxylic transport membrane protein
MLLAGSYLCFKTFSFDSPSPEGQIGPEFWPRAICIFMLIVCVTKILHLCVASAAADSAAEAPQTWVAAAAVEGLAASHPGPRNGRFDVWVGIGITALYLLAFPMLGYFLSTFLYMLAFIYLGRYRKIGKILLVGAIGSLVFMFIFMKVVYISLPLGVEPFSRVSVFLLDLMHIR